MTADRDVLVVLTTSDGEEAFAELQRRRRTGEQGWDMAEVRHMDPPPRTMHRYAVFNTAPSGRKASA